jgi:hypothetical protein
MKEKDSSSRRINHRLKRGLDLERHYRLEQEAAECFANKTNASLRERAGYQQSTTKSLSRD